LDDETWRLGAMCKNLGRVRIWGQRTKVKVTGTKNEKKLLSIIQLTMHSKAFTVGRTQQAATDDAIAWPPRGDALRRWENQRMLSSSR